MFMFSGVFILCWDLNFSVCNYNFLVLVIYVCESVFIGDFCLCDSGDFVWVSGEGDFVWLVLGWVDVFMILFVVFGSMGNGVKDIFVSLLFEEYMIFFKLVVGSG